MRPVKRIDAVDLHETKRVNQPIEIGASSRPRLRAQQQGPVQKQTTGDAIIQEGARHTTRLSLRFAGGN